MNIAGVRSRNERSFQNSRFGIANMEIDHVVAVDTLYADGKRLSRMESERDQATRWLRTTILQAGINAEFE